MQHSRPYYFAAISAIVVALTIGWTLGSWSTCGSRCSFNVALFDAVGTWVGGVGITTVGGLYVWRRNRREDQLATEAAWRDAYMCTLRSSPLEWDNTWSRVQVEFTNQLREPVTEVSMHLIGGTTLRHDKLVAPGRLWGHSFSFADLNLAPCQDEPGARTLIKREVRPKLVFVFTLRGNQFLRSGKELFHYDKAPPCLLPKG